jgi:AcrR family transcriptional regulator
MRDIAEGAGVALGAAYYYFPSKDALVLAYYDHTQRACSERAAAAFAESGDVRARLGAVFHGKLDVLARDRRLLLAIFRSVADRDAEASLFGVASAEVREESIRLLDEAIGTSEAIATLDRDARRVVALAFWSLQMGTLLYFIHDTSPRQAKTRRLIDRALDLTCRLLPLAGELAPMLGAEVASMLAEANLLGEKRAGRRRLGARSQKR